jgi:hypothetical protein
MVFEMSNQMQLNQIKEFDLTIVVPVSDWGRGDLQTTINSVKNYIESCPLTVDCLIAEIIPGDKDVELTLFQEIEALPAFVAEALGTQYFRYLAEVDYTARALRKILLNCRGRRVLILGEGMEIGLSSARAPENTNTLATVFPEVRHKASIQHWNLLSSISKKLSGIPAFSVISLASVSQISFDREKVIEMLKCQEQFSKDLCLFQKVLKECIITSYLSSPSSIEIGTSTAVTDPHCRHTSSPINVDQFRNKLYSNEINASSDSKIAADFILDYSEKAYQGQPDIDWVYPAKHFELEPTPYGINAFSLVIGSLAALFKCTQTEAETTTRLLHNAHTTLQRFLEKKADPDTNVLVSVISSLFREKDMVGGFLSNIISLHDFQFDHELILVLPERDISQGAIIDIYSLFHPRIRVLQLEADPGIYNCWNIAISTARGKYLTNANCDDRRASSHTRDIANALDQYNGHVGSSAIIATDSLDFIVNTNYSNAIQETETDAAWYRNGDNEMVAEKSLRDFFILNDSSEIIQCYNFPHCMPVWRRDIHNELGLFSEEIHGTYSDFALWLNAAKSGKRFIHLNKVLGAYFIRENSHNRKNSDVQKWLRIVQDAMPSSNISSLSYHVTSSIPSENGSRNDLTSNSVDFGSQISQNYGNHRAGWSWVVSHLEPLHDSESSVYCDVFLEKKFVWGNDEGDAWHPSARPFDKSWIGFLHVPPHVPSFFQYEQSNQQVFRSSLFKRSFSHCKALIALTEYHANYLRQVFRDTHIQIFSIHHPTEVPDSTHWFSWEKFQDIKQKRVVQVGWWLRKLNAINYLQLQGSDFLPLMLGNCDWNRALISYSERRYHGLSKPTTAEVVPFLDNEAYDKLLTSCVVFIDFYDTSANNAIIECIARRTPALVPKHPAIKEYLGDEYPLYFNGLDDVPILLRDAARVRDAHHYLAQEDVQRLIDIDKFTGSFRNIIASS